MIHVQKKNDKLLLCYDINTNCYENFHSHLIKAPEKNCKDPKKQEKVAGLTLH